MTVPTKEEVDERHKERSPNDMFGFETDEYTPYMTIEGMRPLAKDGVTDETLKGIQMELTRELITDEIRTYMSFAMDKAKGQRGISANRSIEHYIAWTWLAGDAEFSSKIEKMHADEYHSYGIPILEEICKFYGFEKSDEV